MKNISSQSKQSWFFGTIIAVGLLLIIGVVLDHIKIVPYTVYRSKEFRFEIKYPSYWQMVEKPEGGAAVVFVAPLQGKGDGFHENLNVVYQNIAANPMSLNQYSSLAMKQITGTLEGAVEVLESSPTKLAGRPAYRFVFAGKAPNLAHPIQYYHVWVLDGLNAYIITFAGWKEDFQDYKSKLNDMLRSFKIL